MIYEKSVSSGDEKTKKVNNCRALCTLLEHLLDTTKEPTILGCHLMNK